MKIPQKCFFDLFCLVAVFVDLAGDGEGGGGPFCIISIWFSQILLFLYFVSIHLLFIIELFIVWGPSLVAFWAPQRHPKLRLFRERGTCYLCSCAVYPILTLLRGACMGACPLPSCVVLWFAFFIPTLVAAQLMHAMQRDDIPER